MAAPTAANRNARESRMSARQVRTAKRKLAGIPNDVLRDVPNLVQWFCEKIECAS